MRNLWMPLAMAAGVAAAVSAYEVKEYHSTVPLAADGRLVLDTHQGSVEIETWDRPSVEVHARIEPAGFALDGGAQVRDTEVRIDSTPAWVRIGSCHRGPERRSWLFGLAGKSPHVHYRIRMPRTARLRLRDHDSAIRVGDLRAGLELSTHSGSAVVAAVEGSLYLETYRGHIRVKEARINGGGRARTHYGTIELAVPRGRGFDFDATLGRHARFNGNCAPRHGRQPGEFSRSVAGGGPTLWLSAERGTLRLDTV